MKIRPSLTSAALLGATVLALVLGASPAFGAVTHPASAQDPAPALASGHLGGLSTAMRGVRAQAVPTPAHVVIVIMENHSYNQIIGSSHAPYVNRLATEGALFTRSYAISHPSEPNYLALFSGSTQSVSSDSCPHRYSSANLGSELIAAHLTFAGYSEGLPRTGSPVCSSGDYARKHVPWVNFTNVPASDSKPFTSFPAGSYGNLPTVSFVIPNVCHDMDNCSVATGDGWLKAHVAGYAAWAQTHHSLLILTWDEDEGNAGNHIPTIFIGQAVNQGKYSVRITHYSVLRTIESLYHLRLDGHAATASTIDAVWK
jgi:hypothetical protein